MHELRRLWTDESGQDMVEYALLLALLTIVALVSIRLFGTTIASFWNSISNNLRNV